MGAPVVLGAIAAGGAITSVIGQLNAAAAQASAAEREAALKRRQADEILSRQSVNEGILQEAELEAESSFASAFSASGRSGGIGGAIKMRQNFLKTIENSRREASFKAEMLRAGADVSTELASDALTSGQWGAVGTLLTGGANAYLTFKPKPSPVSIT